jgi:hypothetical protein
MSCHAVKHNVDLEKPFYHQPRRLRFLRHQARNGDAARPAPRSRREWAELADNAEPVHLAGKLQVDDRGGFLAMIVTCGPRFYVRRLFERIAKRDGFIVRSVKRSDPPLVNPFTGEFNHGYAIRLERRQ